jgi:hypothetical protein
MYAHTSTSPCAHDIEHDTPDMLQKEPHRECDLKDNTDEILYNQKLGMHGFLLIYLLARTLSNMKNIEE